MNGMFDISHWEETIQKSKSTTQMLRLTSICAWYILLIIKCNSLFYINKLVASFHVGYEAMVQIPRFVALVCCINDIVIQMIKIILLTSPQLMLLERENK